ncbi:putative glutamate mutase MutL [Kribbella flavida DSM 17836]|uniref:Putative glutamate mutase MutL n=1 Tax=Kribbella flavida (strain DSM 17836 / JCM 10339 / NBRC 14399) TaxID=479435 RepID=D2PP51_KRIFD|nr:glutamate mutase L [Kribbella flavida]ADB34647.1 putative glutamate mutase MutL [Kribbella flavida DSM 17836]
MSGLVVAVDFGSTFTKAVAVDAGSGDLVARAEHRTTIGTDVMDGWHTCRRQLLAVDRRVERAEVMACSSAGGGLRIAVVGNEELVTAEAGRRVALSSGGRVVAVVSGGLTATSLKALRADRPDVVLLLGGTDGGNAAVLTRTAEVLAKYRWRKPVVAAGNVDARDEVAGLLAGGGVPAVLADNVVPEIGLFAPDSARAAIREMFLAHVIGGKNLSRDPAFAAMVRAATPDVVLRGVEVLAGLHGDVAVVDIGGATTDVHSVIELDPEDANLGREVVATHPVTRTVEGDLGMRWSAVPVVAAGVEAGLVAADAELAEAARRRHDDPAYLPDSAAEAAYDETLARVAATVALRRHAGRQRVVFGPGGRVIERSGKDLREVDLLVGSGGVLRHNGPEVAERILGAVAVGAREEGWLVPAEARVCVDRDYVLAAVGLLAETDPVAAEGLAHRVGTDRHGSVRAGH